MRTPNGVPKLTEIELGSRSCYLIKRIYFPEVTWVQAKDKVAAKLSVLKDIMRKRHPEISREEIARVLSEYDEFDLRDDLDAKESR